MTCSSPKQVPELPHQPPAQDQKKANGARYLSRHEFNRARDLRY